MAEQILKMLLDTEKELLQLISGIEEARLNKIPFKGSWTAAQVADHVTKSNRAFVHSLTVSGTQSSRHTDQHVKKFKDLLLDFTTKLESPEFIVPRDDPRQPSEVRAALHQSIKALQAAAENADLSEVIDHPALKEVTKLEIIHFIVYHTQRHIHQLNNILLILHVKSGNIQIQHKAFNLFLTSK